MPQAYWFQEGNIRQRYLHIRIRHHCILDIKLRINKQKIKLIIKQLEVLQLCLVKQRRLSEAFEEIM